MAVVVPKLTELLKSAPKQEHPLYATTNNVIGAKKPCVFDVPTNYLCAAPAAPALFCSGAAGETVVSRGV